jgi:hypothetical protein
MRSLAEGKSKRDDNDDGLSGDLVARETTSGRKGPPGLPVASCFLGNKSMNEGADDAHSQIRFRCSARRPPVGCLVRKQRAVPSIAIAYWNDSKCEDA